jgi:hypothetical protein
MVVAVMGRIRDLDSEFPKFWVGYSLLFSNSGNVPNKVKEKCFAAGQNNALAISLL